MTSLTTTLRRTKPSTIGWTFGFALALTAAAQITIPIPGTPVPFTLQPLVVVLAGLMLGPVAGAMSMLIYLAAGSVGLPVFSPVGLPGVARLFGPTGGYLIAYPVAAFAAGKLAGTHSTILRRFLAACGGIALIFVGGIAQLSVLTGSLPQAIRLGVTPFAALDIVKALIAAVASASRVRRDV
jgi:biotin transport system substrate-specific component